MKAYIATTGCLFLLLVVVHVARIIAEGVHPLSQPVFVIATLASLAMAGWAALLLMRSARR